MLTEPAVNSNQFQSLFFLLFPVTLSWPRPLSYRNQSIDLHQWTGFYIITAPLHERVKNNIEKYIFGDIVNKKCKYHWKSLFAEFKILFVNNDCYIYWRYSQMMWSLKKLQIFVGVSINWKISEKDNFL